jgi:hypothetical protein
MSRTALLLSAVLEGVEDSWRGRREVKVKGTLLVSRPEDKAGREQPSLVLGYVISYPHLTPTWRWHGSGCSILVVGSEK